MFNENFDFKKTYLKKICVENRVCRNFIIFQSAMKLLEIHPISIPNISWFSLCWFGEEKMIWFSSFGALGTVRGRACLPWLTKCVWFSFIVTHIRLWPFSSIWTPRPDFGGFLPRIPMESHFQHWLGNLQRSNYFNVFGTNYQSVIIPAKPFSEYFQLFFSCNVAESP